MSTSACLGDSIRYAGSSTRGVRANAYRECTCQLAEIHAGITSVRLCVRYVYIRVCVFLSVYISADIREYAMHRTYRPYTHDRRWRAAYVVTTGARRVWQEHLYTVAHMYGVYQKWYVYVYTTPRETACFMCGRISWRFEKVINNFFGRARAQYVCMYTHI